MKEPIITFDEGLKIEVLKAFGKIEKNGQVVEKKGETPVPAMGGGPFSVEEFGGIAKGSEIYIKSDITSLIDYYEGK